MEIEIAKVRQWLKVELEDIAEMMLSGVDTLDAYQNLVGRAATAQRLSDKLKEWEVNQSAAMGIEPQAE